MFNQIKENLFYSHYFITLNSSIDACEMQSRIYGGYWLVQKITPNSSEILIHHKSSLYGEYHFFDVEKNIKNAIKTIKAYESEHEYFYYL